MYGPKGIGALFVRGGARRWPWVRPFRGGGQESDLRPGTSNVPAIVGFGEACVLAADTLEENTCRLKRLSKTFVARLQSIMPQAQLVNEPETSLPGTLSVLFSGIPADLLLAHCRNISLSKGSACNGAVGASHVVAAVVEDTELRESVVRFSFGKGTSAATFDEFFEILDGITLES